MQAQDRPLKILFETSIRLVVPQFQRPYVWQQNSNWKPLWATVTEVVTRRLGNLEPRRRFLGSIVLGDLNMPTGEVTARQVIDGQQRLTTLQVLIAVLRDLATASGADGYAKAFECMLRNVVPDQVDPASIYKVWPSSQDREAFKTVMEAGSRAAVDDRCASKSGKAAGLDLHLIPKAYLYFYDHAAQMLEKAREVNPNDVLKAFHHGLRDDLVLVVVDLDTKDDAQLIFETLNALGTPLLPADLVKNYLFHRAQTEEAPVDQLYDEHWKALDDDHGFWRAEVRQGRFKRPRIDLFLAHYLALKSRTIVGFSHLFGTFRELAEHGKEPAETQMRRLREYADVYRGFHEFQEPSREARFFRRLEALDTSMVYPVLLEVLRESRDEDETRRFLDMIESYLMRRAICGLTYKAYNRTFVELIKHLGDHGFNSQALEAFLLSREGDSNIWPTDAQLQQSFETYPAYIKIKQSRVLMILEAIESELRARDSKTENISFHEKLTIEHVMPREWRTRWALPPGTNGEHEARRESLIHAFGNLTLVTKHLNPSLSNSAWSDKRPALLKHSGLALNRAFQEQHEWHEEAIIARGREMAKVAVSLWPRPAS